jgi:hypothetical protein
MFHLVSDFFFTFLCGAVGHGVVRVLTLGRVKLDWGEGSESHVTEAVGAIFLLLLGIIATLWLV